MTHAAGRATHTSAPRRPCRPSWWRTSCGSLGVLLRVRSVDRAPSEPTSVAKNSESEPRAATSRQPIIRDPFDQQTYGIVNPTNSKAEMFGGGVAERRLRRRRRHRPLRRARQHRAEPAVSQRRRQSFHGRGRRGRRRPRDCHGRQGYLHSGPVFADVDGDGDLDLFVGGMEGDPCLLYENNGDGTFTDVTDAVRYRHDGRDEHDLRVVRRLRPRRRPRHDARALGHAASAGRLAAATATRNRCGATTATRTASTSPT